MSKIKELKTNPEHIINLVDALQLICPTDKIKYLEMFLRIMKGTPNMDELNIDLKETLISRYNVNSEMLNQIPKFQWAFIYNFFDKWFNDTDIIAFQKFCEYNEKGLIPENDVLKYTNFSEISKQVEIAQIKVDAKELETQVVKVYENEEWLVLRPLTHKSSCKYGANTKWCTAGNGDGSTFRRYAKDGILIYCINKVTALKVAAYKDLSKKMDISFWNQVDEKIDSMESTLPQNILNVISDEFTTKKSNTSYLTPEQMEKENRFDNLLSKSIDMGVSERPARMEMEEALNYDDEVENHHMDVEAPSIYGHEVANSNYLPNSR